MCDKAAVGSVIQTQEAALINHTSEILQYRAVRTPAPVWAWTDQSAKWANLRSDQSVFPVQTQGRWISNSLTTISIPYLTQRCRLVQHWSSVCAGGTLQNKETASCALLPSPAHSSLLTSTRGGGQQSNREGEVTTLARWHSAWTKASNPKG